MRITAGRFARGRVRTRRAPAAYQIAMPLRRMALVLLVLLPWPPPAAAEVDGAAVAERCNRCHGEAGRSEQPDVPSIGGFSEFAVLDLMESYRAGFREARRHALPDGGETDMVEVVRSLSGAELEAVARYYAVQPWRPREQDFDAALARRGALVHDLKCSKCHSEGGSVAEDDLAILAGQWRTYLEMEFEDFDSGARRMADKMKEKYDTLSDGDKKALIELYVGAGKY